MKKKPSLKLLDKYFKLGVPQVIDYVLRDISTSASPIISNEYFSVLLHDYPHQKAFITSIAQAEGIDLLKICLLIPSDDSAFYVKSLMTAISRSFEYQRDSQGCLFELLNAAKLDGCDMAIVIGYIEVGFQNCSPVIYDFVKDWINKQKSITCFSALYGAIYEEIRKRGFDYFHLLEDLGVKSNEFATIVSATHRFLVMCSGCETAILDSMLKIVAAHPDCEYSTRRQLVFEIKNYTFENSFAWICDVFKILAKTENAEHNSQHHITSTLAHLMERCDSEEDVAHHVELALPVFKQLLKSYPERTELINEALNFIIKEYTRFFDKGYEVLQEPSGPILDMLSLYLGIGSNDPLVCINKCFGLICLADNPSYVNEKKIRQDFRRHRRFIKKLDLNCQYKGINYPEYDEFHVSPLGRQLLSDFFGEMIVRDCFPEADRAVIIAIAKKYEINLDAAWKANTQRRAEIVKYDEIMKKKKEKEAAELQRLIASL